MPPHPERVRTAPLTSGYQFGDGRYGAYGTGEIGACMADLWRNPPLNWRAPHQNAAEQLARRAFVTDRDCGDEDVT